MFFRFYLVGSLLYVVGSVLSLMKTLALQQLAHEQREAALRIERTVERSPRALASVMACHFPASVLVLERLKLWRDLRSNDRVR